MKPYSEKFDICTAISNNEFSFEKRSKKKIRVPNMIKGRVNDITQGDEFAFIEIGDDGEEICCQGVKNIILQKFQNKEVYIFDNHNHSFYFSYEYFRKTGSKFDFIHIDQHKDLREPNLYFEDYCRNLTGSYDIFKAEMNKVAIEDEAIIKEEFNKKNNYTNLAFLYTNTSLNVGNFIKPLIEIQAINNFYCVDSQYALNEIKSYDVSNHYILDLDLDFFSKEMDYIDESEKITVIKKLINNAQLVLVATSPYFIDFEKCKSIMKILID